MIKSFLAVVLSVGFLIGCTNSTTSSEDNKNIPTVELTDISVSEAFGSATIRLNLSFAALSQVSVDLNVSDGSAIAGVDYNNPGTSRLVFTPGQQTKTVVIQLINDFVKRSDRYFTASLSNPVGVSITKSSAKVTILNSNTIPEINFSSPSQGVLYGSGSLSLKLNLSAPATQQATIPYTVTGSAQQGIDTTFASGFLTIQNGSQSASIDGSILGVPGNRLQNSSFTVTLGSTAGVFVGSMNKTTVYITNNLDTPYAIPSGMPEGTSNFRSLKVSVGGYRVDQYQYKLSSTNNCASPIGYSQFFSSSKIITDSIESLPDGIVYLCLIGSDGSGNVQSYSDSTSVSWTKYSGAPIAPQLKTIASKYSELSSGQVLSNQPTVGVNFTNLISGYSVGLYDSIDCSTNTIINTTEAGKPAVPALISKSDSIITGRYTTDGDHSLSATMIDQYGNRSGCVLILSKYTLDTTAPVVTSVGFFPSSGVFVSNQTFNISVGFSESVTLTKSSNEQLYVILNTAPVSSKAVLTSSNGNTLNFSFTSSTGTNTNALDYLGQSALVLSNATIQDAAGNLANTKLPLISPLSFPNKIIIETTPPPQVLAFSDGVFSSANKTPLFGWVQGINPYGYTIQKYQVSIGTSKGSTDILPWTTVSGTQYQSQSPDAGISWPLPGRVLYGAVRSIDQAGNVSSVTYGLGFKVDGVAPTTPILTDLTDAQKSMFIKTQSPNLSWTKSVDADSGVDHYEVSIGNSQGAADVITWQNVGTNLSTVLSYGGVVGNTYFGNVRSVDKVGNYSQVSSVSWSVREAILDPSPSPTFVPFSNAAQSVPIFSEPITIGSLDLPSPVTISSSDGGDPRIKINGGPPIKSGIVKAGDVIQLVMSSPKWANQTLTATIKFYTYSTAWTVSTWVCPDDYVYVPGSVGSDFCVAKYNGSQFSIPALTTQPNAIKTCSDFGQGYTLITNEQWQTIAKNIESVGANWSSGIPGSGEMNGGVINSSVYPSLPPPSRDDTQACFGSIGLDCVSGTWNKYSRLSKLTNGEVLWDMTGLSWQWVQNVYDYTFFDKSSESYVCPNSVGTNEPCYYNLANSVYSFTNTYFGPQRQYSAPNTIVMNSNPKFSWLGVGSIIDPLISQSDLTYVPMVDFARGGSQGDEDKGYWLGGIYSGRISRQSYQRPFYGYEYRTVFRTPETDILKYLWLVNFDNRYVGGWTEALATQSHPGEKLGYCSSPGCGPISCNGTASCFTATQFGDSCTGQTGPTQNNNGSPYVEIFPSGIGDLVAQGRRSYWEWGQSCSVIKGYNQYPGTEFGSARCVYVNSKPYDVNNPIYQPSN